MSFATAYRGRHVLVTGHTGFKGGWLVAWLHRLGAKVTGYALAAEPGPSLFRAIDVASLCEHIEGDVRDLAAFGAVYDRVQPDFVFHLAAQPLVRLSYSEPLATLATNVMGTAHVLDAVRESGRACSVVVVTSDKCYDNREWTFGYRETDPMGGHDVYSMSKGACELVVDSYRRSFFEGSGIAVGSGRAGNVIGGGDWARDRLVPDAVRALRQKSAVPVRNPRAVRPWQHVLEPLSGYLMLGARLATGEHLARSAWNFGPRVEETLAVGPMMDLFTKLWGDGARWQDASEANAPHEAGLLRLAIDKAVTQLGWLPRWTLEEALGATVAWYKRADTDVATLRALTLEQITAYERAMSGAYG